MVLLGREVVTRTEKKTGGGNAAQDLASRMERVVLRDEQQKRKREIDRTLGGSGFSAVKELSPSSRLNKKY